MKNEFIPYEQALELKELGFEATPLGGFKQDAVFYYEKGELYYDYRPMYSSTAHKGQILAPLYQQAFRWFRENQGYHIDLFVDDDKTFGFCITYFTYIARVDKPIQRQFNTYEEAELECIKKLIEIVKTNEK
jgi:hypothetical protein